MGIYIGVKGYKMKHIERNILYIIYSVGILNFIVFTFEGYIDPWKSLLLGGGFLFLIFIGDVTEVNSKKWIRFLWWAMEIGLVTYMGIYTTGVSFKNFYFIILFYIIFNLGIEKGVGVSVFIMLIRHLIIYNSNILAKDKILAYISDTFLFILVVIIISLLRYIVTKNCELKEAREELIIKNKELNHTYKNLKEAYERLEELTIIKERNKLARDIHDTVGHTLTIALVELEATNIVIDKNLEEGKEKLKNATSEVRNGLRQLRSSVKALKDNDEINYYGEVESLISSSKAHGLINIIYDIEDIRKAKKNEQKVIYRIIQEGLTNGIKHGKATAFVIRVKIEDNRINILVQDNGRGASVYDKGFGLKAMEERVSELGGILYIDTFKDEGFTIKVEI